MANEPAEGTVVFELAPPHPWPVATPELIDQKVHTKDLTIAVHALPQGRLKFVLTVTGQPAEVMISCPLTFKGEGYFRMPVAWRGWNAVAFAGGQCIAAHKSETKPVESAEIELREELPPLADIGVPPEWDYSPGHGGEKY